jgi:hypothetical protein
MCPMCWHVEQAHASSSSIKEMDMSYYDTVDTRHLTRCLKKLESESTGKDTHHVKGKMRLSKETLRIRRQNLNDN